jgi:predicted TIM-barrel fold metal-dependent hydrolase
MAYATGRLFLDADSHVMEPPGFLQEHASASMRERIPEVAPVAGGPVAEKLQSIAARGGHAPEKVQKLIALGDSIISGPKGYDALGAFNGPERAKALDLLGFDRQLVFATFSPGVMFDASLPADVSAEAARAHNRAMAEFCSADQRLIGVGATALDNPEAAVAEIDHIASLGLGAVWVPHRPAGGRSPGHDDLDPVWARAADAGLPILIHVGGVRLQLPPEWTNTGRPVPTDWLGGGENVRGKDMVGLHQPAETFLGVMILDGVLERHPTLRVGAVELGAGWVPAWLRRLDSIATIWRRTEPELAALERLPSEQVRQQMAFTPYPFEDVGALIRESDPSLYMFSSDYPHTEGGRNPLGRFRESLSGCGEEVLDQFYAANMARLCGVR